jgi:hypothetical protein
MNPKQKLSTLLKNYGPRPSAQFYRRMENAPWNRPEPQGIPAAVRPARLVWQTAGALLLVALVAMALLAVGVPSVRASLSAWLGLSVAPSDQMPSVTLTLVAISPPTPAASVPAETAPQTTPPTGAAAPLATPTAVSEANAAQPPEVRQLAPQAGWDILGPATLPQGYAFQSAYYDTNQHLVILTYTATRPLPGATDPSLTATQSITLLQARKNDFIPMQIAPSSRVEDVKVNDQPAVFVVGAWDAQFVPDSQDPNGGKMVSTWRSDLQIQNLYWQVGDVYLVLVSGDETLSQPDLIRMASSIGR